MTLSRVAADQIIRQFRLHEDPRMKEALVRALKAAYDKGYDDGHDDAMSEFESKRR